MLIDVCKDFYQSKTTYYVVFISKYIDDSWRSWNNLNIDYLYAFLIPPAILMEAFYQ